MAVHVIANTPFLPSFLMDMKLFLGKGDQGKITPQMEYPEHFLGKDEQGNVFNRIEEVAAIEPASVHQIAIFFSVRSKWWLNDRYDVSSPLIFVGSAEIELTDTAIKIWDGSEWRTDTAIRVWNGSGWRTDAAIKVWDGSGRQ